MKRPAHLFEAPPVSPGDILREFILEKLDLTQEQLAAAMQVSRLSISQIVNGRRAVTTEMAIRLAHVTSTTPEFWLNLQRNLDLHAAHRKLSKTLSNLTVVRQTKSKRDLFAIR